MAAVSIGLFLVGAVLAWRFRVWILVPIAVLATIGSVTFAFWSGKGFFEVLGAGFLAAAAPQVGYAFGLVGRYSVAAVRAPLSRHPDRKSVAALYQRHEARETR